MRYLILMAVLLAPAVAEAQYYVPRQAWGYRPQAVAPAYNPHFHARVQQHQAWLQQSRAQNPHYWAMEDLRFEMQQELNRRLEEDRFQRRTNPSRWWNGY